MNDKALENMTVDELRDLIDHLDAQRKQVESDRDTQPQQFHDMMLIARAAQQKAFDEEPWNDLWTALPGYTADGEIGGMLALPNLTARDLFGLRLAFEIVCASDEEDVLDILNEFFTHVHSTDHMFLIATAALKSIALYILPTMFEQIEQRASNWNLRVNLADALRNSWEQRVRNFDDPEEDQ